MAIIHKTKLRKLWHDLTNEQKAATKAYAGIITMQK